MTAQLGQGKLGQVGGVKRFLSKGPAGSRQGQSGAAAGSAPDVCLVLYLGKHVLQCTVIRPDLLQAGTSQAVNAQVCMARPCWWRASVLGVGPAWG
jgi:hypothetical protein